MGALFSFLPLRSNHWPALCSVIVAVELMPVVSGLPIASDGLVRAEISTGVNQARKAGTGVEASARTKLLPWAFIDMGVTQRYLQLENERAKQARTTQDCRKGCNGCGLQRYEGLCNV